MSRANIKYTIYTADGCECAINYCATDSGRNFRAFGRSDWQPHEPDAETTSVTVDFLLGHGRREEAELSGDQHRELEDSDKLNDWFAAVAVDGEDPYDALAQLLREPGLAA